MKTKVCGLRQPENIIEVLNLGIDYAGFIFFEGSSRFAGQPAFAKWMAENDDLFTDTKRVGVFVNAGLDIILNTVHDYHLDYVQLHGNESAGYCRELKLLWSVSTLRKATICKAFSITPDFDFSVTNEYADSCELFVFDTGGQKDHGGTGLKWDWDKLREYKGATPFLLSGGIGPDDGRRIRLMDHPQLAGVDLNSKFESEPGLKEVDKLSHFLESLKA
jgi:phosphoribosylanthranilate isomerase